MQINVATFPTMNVCGSCGTVVGPFWDDRNSRWLIQRGRCGRHAAPQGESSWRGFDFNERVALCRCCGTIALQSGSRWSVWFCDACKQEVGLLNGRHGRYTIPIGRHSFHAGWLLSGDRVDDPLSVQVFLDAVNGAGEAMGILGDWARQAVCLNLVAAGAEPTSSLSLPEYCNEVTGTVDTANRFREMCMYLDDRGRELLSAG